MDTEQIMKKLAGQLESIKRHFSVSRLAVFGSVARGEAAAGSDIDILVDFDKKATFDAFMELKFYLEELLETGVDLVTDKALRPQIRKEIEQELINVA